MTQPYQLHHGDCLETLRGMEANSADAIVTDPPAGIAFMGKSWDKDKGGKRQWIAWMQEVAVECLRVLKPGGHALVWALPRTSHWTADAWEEAGWVPREKVYHAFGSGFPKSLDIGKALDKMAGAEREVVGVNEDYLRRKPNGMKTNGATAYGYSASQQETNPNITAPATPAAQEWDGWGTALKPAVEEWWLFRKPFKGTVAANVLAWGVGGLNVDGCRVGTEEIKAHKSGTTSRAYQSEETTTASFMSQATTGRFPAHLTHDGSEEVLGCFPVTTTNKGTARSKHGGGNFWHINHNAGDVLSEGDSGSAARFFQSCPLDREDVEASRLFYQAKASKRDRDEGLDGFEARFSPTMNNGIGGKEHDPDTATPKRNTHPTVKSTALMRWLCRLITPPGGIVIDPFCGSGSTGKACMMEGFRFIGIDLEREHIDIAEARIKWALEQVGKEAAKPEASNQLTIFDQAKTSEKHG